MSENTSISLVEYLEDDEARFQYYRDFVYSNQIHDMYKALLRLALINGGILRITEEHLVFEKGTKILDQIPTSLTSKTSEIEAIKIILKRDNFVSQYLSLIGESEDEVVIQLSNKPYFYS